MAYLFGASHSLPLSVVYRRLLASAVAILALAVPSAASAEVVVDGTVNRITLEGLRKTREAVVYDLLEVTPGDPVTPDLLQSIEETLIDSDLFATVEVTARPITTAGTTDTAIEEDPREIVILLDEKWTLVPIPFFTTDGDSYQGGLIVIETNLLGFNKQLISAGFLGTEGVRGFVAYGDPSVLGSQWTTGLSAGLGRNEEERELPDGTVLRSFEYDQQRLSATVGYNFTRRFSVSGGIGYERWELISGDDLEDGQLWEPAVTTRYNATRPVDVLRVGPTAQLGARTVTYQSGWEVSADAEWAVPVATTHRVRLTASGGIGDMPTVAEAVLSGDGYRTLPFQSVAADRWGSVSTTYDLPVLSAGWGALVLSHFWELGNYTNDDVDPRSFYGPGGGFRVYIRQVAIPALGLDVAYNIPDRGIAFSFSLGAQM
ncbi:MAG: POTRA domain-containing protein [Alkalispirochaeta sp.]